MGIIGFPVSCCCAKGSELVQRGSRLTKNQLFVEHSQCHRRTRLRQPEYLIIANRSRAEVAKALDEPQIGYRFARYDGTLLQMRRLKICIRSRTSQKLYCTSKTWTDEIANAKMFDSALAAFYFAADAELHDVEIVWLPEHGSSPQSILNQHKGGSAVRRAVQPSARRRLAARVS